MNKGESRANANRRIRQEELREKLAACGHIQHVTEISNKLSDLDTALDSTQVQRLKASADIQIKLVNKYLPDLRSMELSSDPESPLIPPNMIFRPLERQDS